MKYWLLKSEPDAWSWENQVKEGASMWDGVRNYQARNNLKEMKKIINKNLLIEIRDLLDKIDNWSQEAIDSVLKEYQLKNELSVPAVNQPIRISLTGSTKSPGLGLTLSIFSKNTALERMNTLIEKLS